MVKLLYKTYKRLDSIESFIFAPRVGYSGNGFGKNGLIIPGKIMTSSPQTKKVALSNFFLLRGFPWASFEFKAFH